MPHQGTTVDGKGILRPDTNPATKLTKPNLPNANTGAPAKPMAKYSNWLNASNRLPITSPGSSTDCT